MSDYHLPYEIWREILTRLPVKSILQMRLVCKQFRLLISDPAFRKAHIKKSQNNHKLLLRHFSDKERLRKHHYLILNDADKKLNVKKSEEIKFPLKVSLNPSYWIVGSVDGLVCLSKGYSSADEIILWNPSIRKCRYLPIQNTNKYGSVCYFVLGFGFDPKTHGYKVVRLTYLKNNDGFPPTIELFSLRSQSWRTLISNVDAFRHVCSSQTCYADHGSSPFVIQENIWPQTYLNAAVHWIGYESNRIPLGNLIISFDMTDELFGKVMLPDVLVTENASGLSLSVLKNTLSVTHFEKNSGQERYSIWVMEEYGQASSWTKHYTIDLHGKISKMIDFRKNGEVIVATKKGQLITYDPETLRTTHIRGICGAVNSFSVVSYIDSLVLLDQTGD